MLAKLLNPAGLANQPQTPISPSVDPSQHRAKSDSNSDNSVPDDQISISYASYQSQQESLFPTKNTNESDRFQTTINNLREKSASGQLDYASSDSYENQIRQGITAIGGYRQLENWREQGLKLTEQTLLNAGTALNEGLRQLKGDGTYSRKGLVMNRFDLVKQNQEVPEWFAEEKQKALKTMPESAASAIRKGHTFYVGSTR